MKAGLIDVDQITDTVLLRCVRVRDKSQGHKVLSPKKILNDYVP